MKYISNILILWLGIMVPAVAQDSLGWRRLLPQAIRVGVDVVPPVRGQVTPSFQGWETQVDAAFGTYYLVGELGRTTRSWTDYESTGNFYRFGVDANFLRKDPDQHVFALGFRYGHANFSERLVIIREDPVYGTLQELNVNQDARADWGEVGVTLKVNVWRNFSVGYSARYKFGIGVANSAGIKAAHVPGYGSTDRPATWGFNYYLMFRIPFRKN